MIWRLILERLKKRSLSSSHRYNASGQSASGSHRTQEAEEEEEVT